MCNKCFISFYLFIADFPSIVLDFKRLCIEFFIKFFSYVLSEFKMQVVFLFRGFQESIQLYVLKYKSLLSYFSMIDLLILLKENRKP